MVERAKEERHINSGESDHSFLNITNQYHEPNPDVLELALYAYLIMLHLMSEELIKSMWVGLPPGVDSAFFVVFIDRKGLFFSSC